MSEGEMLKCAFCGRRLEATAAWKGHGERYYCNEFCAEEAFCAEADQPDWPLLVGSVPPTVNVRKRP
jgi:hypothetical protein